VCAFHVQRITPKYNPSITRASKKKKLNKITTTIIIIIIKRDIKKCMYYRGIVFYTYIHIISIICNACTTTATIIAVMSMNTYIYTMYNTIYATRMYEIIIPGDLLIITFFKTYFVAYHQVKTMTSKINKYFILFFLFI
jgi:hypothetical protein